MYQHMQGRNISALLNPRPLVVVTVRDAQGKANACTAAWTTPLSHNPPLVALALKPGSKTSQIACEQGELVINILDKSQGMLPRQFGNSSGHDVDKDSMLKDISQDSHLMSPPALKDVSGRLECRVTETMQTGDHLLFILEVLFAESQGELLEGLLFSEDTLLMTQRDSFTSAQTCSHNGEGAGEPTSNEHVSNESASNESASNEPVLFTLREPLADELPLLNQLLTSEGFDSIEDLEGVTVAANENNEPVGFIRLIMADDGFVHIYPVVVYANWRGYGVGKALVEDTMSSFGKVKLVSRGYANEFYEKLGFTKAAWEDIDARVVEDCVGCEMYEECEPQPYRFENCAYV